MNKIKINKGQYNRLFATGKIKELIIESEIRGVKDILTNEVNSLIKYLYGKDTKLSDFWGENNISYNTICKVLLDNGILLPNGEHYKLSKKFGQPEQVKEMVVSILSDLVKKHKVKRIEEDWFDNLSTNPANQNEPEYNREIVSGDFSVLVYNDEIAIIEGNGNKYVFYYGDINREDFEEYADRYVVDKEDDGEGGYSEYLNDDWEIDGQAIESYINDNIGSFKIGKGVDDFENGDFKVVLIDDELRNELKNYYKRNQKFVNSLNEDEEQELRNHWETFKNKVINARTKKGPSHSQEEILNKLKAIRDRELKQRETEEPIEEITTSGSSGSFSAPLFTDKKIEEVTNTVGSVGAYDANALPNIGRNGEFKKTTQKPEGFKKTTYKGGAFVELDDCSKLDNNKKPCDATPERIKLKKSV